MTFELKYIKTLFTLFSILLLNSISNAQDIGAKAQVKVYGFDEGLSHRNVFRVQQDSMGYIWAATINGLNRFDTESFLKYSALDGSLNLPSDYISNVAFADDSIAYLSIPNHIARLNTFEKTSKLVYSGVDEKTTTTFSSLKFDDQKNLWFFANTEGGGSTLHKLNQANEIKTIKKCTGTFAKRSICLRQNNIIITYDNNSLLELDHSGQILKEHKLIDNIGFSPNLWVVALRVDDQGKVWALCENGSLFVQKSEHERFEKVSLPLDSQFESFTDLQVEDQEHLWLCGNGILLRFNYLDQSIINYQSNVHDIIKFKANYRNIYIDKTGIVWLASDFGLIKIVILNPLFKSYMSEINEYCYETNCSMRGITGDEKGNVYFSYYNSIHKLNTRTGALSPIFSRGKYFNPPFGILYDDGIIWTGNGRRVDIANNKIDTILSLPATDLGDVMKDHLGNIWFGYRNVIAYYNDAQSKLVYYKDRKNKLDSNDIEISYIYQGADKKSFWLGTMEHGLYHLHKSEGTIANYNVDREDALKIEHNKINGIYEDKYNNVWFATGKGLGKLDQQKNEISIYGKDHGIANEFINGLLSEGDSVIWLSTDLGLARFSVAQAEFTNFSKEDGLSGNEFNRISFYKSKQNVMYFGGLNGVNSFIPGNHLLQQKENIEGSILLSSFSKLDGRSDSLVNITNGFSNNQKILLHWKDKFFSFQYTLANFANPSAHLFSYKLDGFDKEWSQASNYNLARFNNVPHGDYIFRVRAKSGNGDWNKNELAIPLTVQKAFFKTWWFIGLSIIGIIATFLAISQYRLNQANKTEVLLRKKVKLRTEELETEMKKSDDLLLNILPEKIAQELKINGSVKAKRHDNVTVFLSDFVGFTLISQLLEPEELVNEIDFYFSEFDKIVYKHGLEKIKTIGDAYMFVGGLTQSKDQGAKEVVSAALEIQEFIKKISEERSQSGMPFFETRIGVHTGPVVSGVVGIKKFAYDIWGDTVNIASRLEGNGAAGKVNISQTTFDLIKKDFECLSRGKVKIKHDLAIEMYFVENEA